MRTKSKQVSVYFVPDDGATPRVWRLSRASVRLAVAGAIGFVILVALGAASYWKVASVALRTKAVEERNELLELEAGKMAQLRRTFEEIRVRDRQLRIMLGLEELDPSLADERPTSPVLPGSEPMGGGISPGDRVEPIAQFLPSGQPVDGWITGGFEGESTPVGRRHEGIDIAAKHGAAVKATADGVVLFAGWDDALGNLVTINHGGYFTTRYGHNSEILVKQGDPVWKGQVIALVGNTGHSTAPHLHYEVLERGQPKDPRKFLLVK